MASIFKRPNGTFQTRMIGTDGKLMTRVFKSEKDAKQFATSAENQKYKGVIVTGSSRHLTLDEYTMLWFSDVDSLASRGWRNIQKQLYRDYIFPPLGAVKLNAIQTPMIVRMLNEMTNRGLSEQTRAHVYSLLRKMFSDAIEMYQLITFNPVIRKLKPKVPVKEARHLSVGQIKQLLTHVRDRTYGAAIYIQLYLGLRVGELIALKWSDLDLDGGIAHISRAYVRKERCIRNYPKGRRQHSKSIPIELLELLRRQTGKTTSDWVASSPAGEMLSYEWYFRSLKRYCKEVGIPEVGTHGLRHSTSELYLTSGATRDDIRELFAHSSSSVTERYIHGRTNLEHVAKAIRILPSSVSTDRPSLVSTDCPRCEVQNI